MTPEPALLLATISALELLLFPGLGALAFLFVLRTGHLRPHALDQAPRRTPSLMMHDLGIALGIFLLGSVMLGVALPFLTAALRISKDPDDPWLAVFQSVTGQGFVFGPMAVYVVLRMAMSPAGPIQAGLWPRQTRDEAARAGWTLLAVIPMVMGMGALVSGIGQWLGHPPPDFGHDLLRVMCDSDSELARTILILTAVLAAPLLEEIIFRGLVQSVLVGALGTDRRWIAIVLASALFTAIHGSVAWQSIPALMVLAVTLGWLYERTGSLFPCILVHAGFNAFNTAMALLICATEKG